MNIDPGAITLIQTSFLQHLSAIFLTVARYALNLLYIFAVLELVIAGLFWALGQSLGWGRLFFKVLKIGLIFFVIQNYGWLINSIISSFAQVAGFTINNPKLADFIFNPAAIWQYGYNVGLFLLQQGMQSASMGLTLILSFLGMGILLLFGLLGIQVIIQIVGFYLVSLTSLLMLPFGVFQPASKMFDRAVQMVLAAGLRVMAVIMVIGVAVGVWNGFNLNEMATNLVNISQPLGLFFTALLFLSLAIYLPHIAGKVVGSISSSFGERGGAVAIGETMGGGGAGLATAASSDLSNMQAATIIGGATPMAMGGGVAASQAASMAAGTEIGGAASGAAAGGGAMATRGFGGNEASAPNLGARDLLKQASSIQRSISKETVRKIQSTLAQLVQEQQNKL
jgi:type IV secretion system protein TrbL